MRALAVRNGLWNASSTAFMTVTSIVGSVLIVKRFTPEEYGAFSYYLWLAGIIIAIGTLAIPLSLTKVTSELIGDGNEDEAGALSLSVMAFVAGLSIFLVGAVLAWALLVPSAQRGPLLVIAAIVVPGSLSGIALSILWGRQRYKPVAITLLVASAVQLLLIVFGFQQGWSLPGFLGAALSLNLVQAVVLLAIIVADRSGESLIRFSLPRRNTLRRFSMFLIPATLSHLVTMIVWERSEVFFLERYSTLTQVGIYSLAYTIVALGLTLGWSLVSAFYPAISNDYGAKRWAGVQEKLSQGTILAAIYAVPLMFGGWIVLEQLVTLLYGTKMLDAVPVAQILFAGLIPGVIGGMFGIAIGAIGGMWLLVRVGLVIAVVNVVLALLLIPPYGAVGAAVANTGSQFIHVSLLVVAIVWNYRLAIPWKPVTRVVALGAFSTLLLPALIQDLIPGLPGLGLAIGTSACAYIVGIWALGFVRELWPSAGAPVPIQ